MKNKELESWIVKNVKWFWTAGGTWSLYLIFQIASRSGGSITKEMVKGLLLLYLTLRVFLFALMLLVGKMNGRMISSCVGGITFAFPCSMYFYMQRELFISIGLSFAVLASCSAILYFQKTNSKCPDENPFEKESQEP